HSDTDGSIMKALVTIATGANYQEQIARFTHPGLSAYAQQIGADFISVNTSDGPPYLEKFRLANFLDLYERVLFMDTDIVIVDPCPDVFTRVPDDAFGARFETPGRYADQIVRAQHELGDIGWTQNYFNSGVMVVSRAHHAIFENAKALSSF